MKSIMSLLAYCVCSFVLMVASLTLVSVNTSLMPLMLGVGVGVMYRIKPHYALSFVMLICAVYVTYGVLQTSFAQLELHNPTKYSVEKHNMHLGVFLLLDFLVLAPMSYVLGAVTARLLTYVKNKFFDQR